jgi:hypothetical protein
MRVLFVHQNFPGQYLHLAPALAARGDEVVALAIEGKKPSPGVRVITYKPRRGSSESIHPWVADIETKVIRGEAAARAALELRNRGFVPDVICAHPGWGEALFLKDVFAKTRMLSFVEFYYRAEGPKFTSQVQRRYRPELQWQRNMISSTWTSALRCRGFMKPAHRAVRSAGSSGGAPRR